MKYESTKKAYKEILDLIVKHKDICIYDIRELEDKADKHLFGLELKEKYGLDIQIEYIMSVDYMNFPDDRTVGRWGEKYRRTISWEDNGKQPKDELLFKLGFCTGAFMFGEDYPRELFKEFFEELKTYKPKYIDSHNYDLYFSMDNAKTIFNKYPSILKKYREKYQKESKQRKIEKLKGELEELNK